ncbi:MAG TPA: AraC family ligand binding domain-containing protein [Acidimicrobiia bacterium]|nr:AraC family ligand binding domain-containing protein [Acidimicrobiia bacterium]
MAEAAFADEGLSPQTWSNGPGYVYGEHHHPYLKVLFCVAGSIVFHTPQGDIAMGAGDRLDLPPGTTHSATVGPSGVTCMEAARS